MSKYKQLLWSDMPSETSKKLIDEIAHTLQLYTVALLKVFVDKRSGNKKITHIGSGTLVSIDNVYGILTAHHVIRELEYGEHLGLTIAREGQEHEFTIPKIDLHIIDIGIPETEKNGPDLSFVVIPALNVGTIKATKHFYPILPDQERMLSEDKPIVGIWCICGSPEEMTIEESSEVFNKVISFCNYCGIGGIPSYDEKEGWDYCEITVDYKQDSRIPQKFNGVSGGGLWQILIVSEPDNPYKIKDHILSGVVFWQSAKDGDSRNLRCHSRKSVYQKVIKAVQERNNK
ncbi:MAG: hypothetical protein HOP27_10660 [Anaerolineales bacterium]|nr:hypothetical protein [Anaerolineales bacterium]